MSRWTMPLPWAASRASAIWMPSSSSSSVGSGLPARSVLQRPAFQQLHGDEGLARVLVDVVNGADVRMVQRRRPRGPRAGSAPAPAGPAACFGQELQGHLAAEPGVLRPGRRRPCRRRRACPGCDSGRSTGRSRRGLNCVSCRLRSTESCLFWLRPKGRAAVRAANRCQRPTFSVLDRALAVGTGQLHGSISAQVGDNLAAFSPVALGRSMKGVPLLFAGIRPEQMSSFDSFTAGDALAVRKRWNDGAAIQAFERPSAN